MHIVRAVVAVLAVVLFGNSVALAAGVPMDAGKLKHALTARGVGKSVKVTELDGTLVSGNLAAIRDDGFDVAVKGMQPMTIPYAEVSKVGNGGLSTGVKIGIVLGCVVVAVAVTAVIIASKFRGPNITF